MNNAGVLDDYLEELLGDALPAAPVAAVAAVATVAEAVEAVEPVAVNAGTEAVPVPVPAFLDLLDEVRNDPALSGLMTVDAEPSARPDWNDLPHEVVYETAGPTAAEAATPAPGFADLLDEVRNDPALSGLMAMDAPPAAAPAAAAEARPDWNDLPAEALHDSASTPAPSAPSPPPAAPAPAPVAAPARPVAPAARALPPGPPMFSVPSSRTHPPRTPGARPSSWDELQAQARNPASSPRESRRANERTSRWLRLRCGEQAYALELLKVQEVVLPVPLLPLRGTSPAMLGIMNLRGQVVPVMDLGIHLGSSAAGNDANTRIVVLEENGETMGLRVSAVEDVANLTDSQIEPPDTARICQISNDLFRGVARCGAQPMILLDATQLLN